MSLFPSRILKLIAIPILAQCAELPKADSILDRYVAATGGAKAYASLRTQAFSAHVEVLGEGIRGTRTTVSAYPIQTHSIMDLGALGRFENGVWNGCVWESSPPKGNRLIDGLQRQLMLRTNDIRAAAEWRKYFDTVTTEGLEPVDGRSCYRVTARPKGGGHPQTSWFDKDNGLLVRTRMMMITHSEEVPIEIAVSDYRRVGAFLLPHQSVQHIGQQRISSRIQQIHVNLDIDRAQFMPPPDIQLIIGKEVQKTIR